MHKTMTIHAEILLKLSFVFLILFPISEARAISSPKSIVPQDLALAQVEGEKLVGRFQIGLETIRKITPIDEQSFPNILPFNFADESFVGTEINKNTVKKVIASNFQILNQHQTGTSEGIFDQTRRAFIEDLLIGEPLAALNLGELIENYVRPKYAYLLIRPGNAIPRHSEGGFYGEYFFIFKKHILRRTTWMQGDSFDRIITFLSKSGYPSKTTDPNFFKSYAEKRNLIQTTLAAGWGGTFVDRRLPIYQDFTDDHPGHYLEAQIWGPIQKGDIDSVLIPEELKNDSLTKQIISKGIPVYLKRTVLDGHYTRVTKGKQIHPNLPTPIFQNTADHQ